MAGICPASTPLAFDKNTVRAVRAARASRRLVRSSAATIPRHASNRDGYLRPSESATASAITRVTVTFRRRASSLIIWLIGSAARKERMSRGTGASGVLSGFALRVLSRVSFCVVRLIYA